MPQKILNIPGQRFYLSGSPTLIDQGLDCYTLGPNNTGGFTTAPVKIPDDCDVSRPIGLYLAFLNAATSVNPGSLAVFAVIPVKTGPGLTTVLGPQTTYFAIPDPYLVRQYAEILLDNLYFVDPSPGYTWPGGYFKPDDLFGLSVERLGADPDDSYPNGSILIANIKMKYYVRCQKCCC